MAGWKCEVCGKDSNNDHSKLECGHYYGRRKESTRFDLENCLSLCKNCHWKFHENKQLHTDFMIKKLGKKRFDMLTIRANTPLGMPKTFQDNNVIIFCKEWFKKLEEK